MGVRGVMTFLRTHLSGVATHSRVEGRDLVVDGNNFSHWFHQEHRLGDLSEVSSRFSLWYREMTRDNRLHFIFDGGFDESKRALKLQRYSEQVQAVMSGDQGSRKAPLPLLFIECIIQAIRTLHGTVMISEGDADRAIIAYANSLNAFAVLSNDTDFIFFDSSQLRLIPLWAFGLDEEGALYAHVVERSRVCNLWRVHSNVNCYDRMTPKR